MPKSTLLLVFFPDSHLSFLSLYFCPGNFFISQRKTKTKKMSAQAAKEIRRKKRLLYQLKAKLTPDSTSAGGASQVKIVGTKRGGPGFGLFDSGDVSFDFPENGISMSKGINNIQNPSSRTAIKGMQAVETTLKYYRTNWEMIQSQPELYAILIEHMAKFLSGGMCIVDGGEVHVPTGEFEELINRMLIPCASRALAWMMCYSFVVWADTWIDGKHIVFVPDPVQIDLEFDRDETTGVTRVLLSWANKDIKPEVSKLHFYDRVSMGLSHGWQCSFVDGVSPLIDKLNELECKRFLILDRAARPPIAVQEKQGGQGGGATVNSDVPLTQRHEVLYFMDEDERRKKDVETYNRLADVVTNANEEASQLKTELEVPPWQRLAGRLREPYENRFVYVPIGLQAARPDTHPPDLSYNQSLADLNKQIRVLMGAPVDEENKTTPIQTMLQDSLARLCSDMIGVLYPEKNIHIVLKNRILEDRDMSMALLKQGGISRDTFDTLHPPPPEREEKKKSTSKK